MEHTPFDTIESAEEFLELLEVETEKTSQEIENLLGEDNNPSSRRVEAIRLVLHKLARLQANTESSRRLLHDLKTLRNLLLK